MTRPRRSYGERSDKQAAYFGLTREQAVELGRQAKRFTADALAEPFTVYTRWNGVFGDPLYYAVVLTADGRDLNELLVSNGLARIYGARTPLPDGRDSRTYRAHLRKLERKAKAAKRGGWGIVVRFRDSTMQPSRSSVRRCMKIVGIDPENTTEKQTAFVTEPPLTEEVFRRYAQMVGEGNYFKCKDGLLITDRSDMTKEYLAQTADFLTQMETQIQHAEQRTKQSREELLQRRSQQTGLPILTSPHVPNAGRPVGGMQ